MRIFRKEELKQSLELIGSDGYCADIAEIARDHLDLLDPPQKISTLNYSREHRRIRNASGTGTHSWRLDKTPYLAEPMEAIDDPNVRAVIVPKPARSGGTVVAENHVLKCCEFGPQTDVMWYLAGPQEVASYADRTFRQIFEDHPRVADKIGTGASDNKLTMKKVSGRTIELLPMNAKTTTNRQGGLIVLDEPDSYSPRFASNWLDQAKQRQRMLGSASKIYACSHPDLGWRGGISQGWLQSSRGIFIVRCPECGGHGSPYPTKHWDEVPRFKLHYQKMPQGASLSERLRTAERTAHIACPHSDCGALLDETQRSEMIEAGSYMHEGQKLDIKAGIIGDDDGNPIKGFWIHVLMATQVSLSELASDLEAAMEHYERTNRTDKLKQVLVRTFGEAFETAGDAVDLDAAKLRKRTSEMAQTEQEDQIVRYRMGEVPPGVEFITASVDTGGKKFDVILKGWDLQRRSWMIDRFTIRQRKHDDGVSRDIRPTSQQDDWAVLESQVIDRLVPFRDNSQLALPVALTVIDSGDGNVTWKAYEFARRMDRKRWGSWRKVRCIKGMSSAKAAFLDPVPTKISRDSQGRVVEPEITLHRVGSHGLKEDVLERLAVEDGSPGQCFFPVNTPKHVFEEYFNEVLDEGKWLRNGPNETLDLDGYAEAARLMLEPDRETISWEGENRPIWAMPVSLGPKGSDPDSGSGQEKARPEPQKKSILEEIAELDEGF